MTPLRLMISALLCAALWGCGGGGGGGDDGGGGVDPGAEVGVSGSAEKGPFVAGSVVTVSQLAANGTSTEIGTTDTNGALGDFDFDFEEGSLLELSVVGNYRNELDGLVSANEITLFGVVQLTNAAEQRAHINVLTHLASARITELLSQGQSAASAIAGARDEVLAGLAPLVAAPAIESFPELTIFGVDGDAESNAYLLAITTFFYQYAADQGGDVDAVLAQLLDDLRMDLSDGAIDDAATLDAVGASIANVDPVRVTSALESMASAVGTKLDIADINRFLDSDLDGEFNADDLDDDDDGVPDSDDVFPYDAGETSDFDGDRVGDNTDRDDDGDGVLDLADAFPLDDSESRDTDDDGVGDNADHDDDADGAADADDDYPLDAACFRLEDGDGEICDVAATIPDVYTAAAALVDGGGIVYLFDPANDRVYRWSSADLGKYLYSLHLDDVAGEPHGTATHVAYSPAHQRLYAGYDGGAITYFDLAASPIVEQSFTAVPLAVDGLAAVGDFLLAQDASGVLATHYAFDVTGKDSDSAESHYSRAYDWNPILRRVYYFSDDASPNDLLYEVISVDGTFTSSGESPYDDYVLDPPIRVSPDGNEVLVGSGNVFEALNLTWLRALPNAVTDAQWLDDNTIVSVREVGGATTLERSTLGVIVESMEVTGTPVAVLPAGDAFVVVTAEDRPRLFFYQPSD